MKQKLFHFFPVLLCFCLPFGSLLLSAIVVCWTVASFFNLSRTRLTQGFRSPWLWAFYAFFLITVASAAMAGSKSEAIFSVEVKLSFLILPYLFACFAWPLDILRRCIVAFVSGCFFASIALLLRAAMHAAQGEPEYFYYTRFSAFLHASYFAMYLVMATVFVVTLYRKWFAGQRAVMISANFFVLVFVACIFLCSSKMGLITFAIVMPVVLWRRWSDAFTGARKWWLAAAGIIVAAMLVVGFRTSLERFSSVSVVTRTGDIDVTSAESSAVRVLIWKEAGGIFARHPLTGVGVAAANDSLYASYEREGLTGALSHRLNAHNQYLQTAVGMGVPGLALLLLLVLWTIPRAIKMRDMVTLTFAFLVFMNFLVDSMLQRADGVLFFTVFSGIFHLAPASRLLDHLPE